MTIVAGAFLLLALIPYAADCGPGGKPVPVALLITILAYVFTGNMVTSVTVLVVFCPGALVLAPSTGIMAAMKGIWRSPGT